MMDATKQAISNVIWKRPTSQPSESVNFGTVSKYFTTIAPIIITSFLVLSSAFNQDYKGFVWLILAAIGLLGIRTLQNVFGAKEDAERRERCQQLWGLGVTFPSATSFFLSFTLFYFLYPMIESKDYNFSALAVLIILYAMDAVFNFINKCSGDDWQWNVASIAIATGLGGLWGLLYYPMKKINGNLVYFGGKASNGEYCSKPKQQTFKCNVYKNGEIISTL